MSSYTSPTKAATDLCLQLLRARIVRVAFFGSIALVAQTIVFEVVGIWLELLRPSLATLLGAEFGIMTSFLLNNRYSFNDRSHAPLLTRLMRFHLVVSGSVFIQWLFVFSAESATSNLWIIHAAYAAGVAVGFISNYTGYRLWVWRHHAPEQNVVK